MNAEAAGKRTWTPDEYLAMERSSPQKHEYSGGEVFAMAGASKEHNLIVTNVVGELRNALRRLPCEVYPSDMRIKIPATGLYTYADASVTCDRPSFEDDEFDTLLNPQVIFEVLSDSTKDYDRGTKFKNYRSIPSLRDYVLVSQNEILVEHFVRHPDGSWILRERRTGELLELASVGCAIPVDELYLKVLGAARAAEP
ncbi:MAG: Uma2 family endonuclease [Polyangiaceae bacterium]|nr:Uma2 family endonuclease [Polyangiaceae bacterium]